MNKIVNKLAGDKFMSKMHLKRLEFAYSACGSFTRYFERIEKFKETGNLKHLHRNKLDRACLAHDVVYSGSKIWLQELFQITF